MTIKVKIILELNKLTKYQKNFQIHYHQLRIKVDFL